MENVMVHLPLSTLELEEEVLALILGESANVFGHRRRLVKVVTVVAMMMLVMKLMIH